MTTASPTQPLTAGVFLFDDAQDGVDALAKALDEKAVLDSVGTALQDLSQSRRRAAGSEVATVTNGLLDIDLAGLVTAGWRKHAALTAAAERTLAAPGSSEVVELAAHRITSTHRPSVELLINEVHAATIRFELRIEFAVQALAVTVRNGHVVSLHSGACDVTATLTAEGRQLVTRRAHFELPLLIRWPLRINPGDDDPPPSSAERLSAPSPASPTTTPKTHRIRLRHRRPRARRAQPAD